MENQNIEQDMIEIDLREYFNILWRRKWIIVGIVVVAIIASYVISNRMTRIYESSTLVMVESERSVGSLFGDGFAALGGDGGRTDVYTELLKSRLILEGVIEELDLRNKKSGQLITAGSLRNKIDIISSGGNKLLTITVEYDDPLQAKKIANTLVSVFQSENQSLNQANLDSSAEFISERLNTVQRDLSNLEEELLEYKLDEEVILPNEQARATLNRLIDLETSDARAVVEIDEAQARLEEVEQQLAKREKEVITSKSIITNRDISTNPEIRSYRQQLSNLEVELIGLRENYTENHPRVLEANKKIEELERRIRNTVEEIVSSKTQSTDSIYSSLEQNFVDLQVSMIANQARRDTYQAQIAKTEQELDTLPQKQLDLSRLERETRIAENLYVMLMERKGDLQIQIAMQSSDMVVVDEAIFNENPTQPQVKLNVAIAAVLAIFIAVGVIFLLEFLDTTVKEEKDIERITGLPVLGVIPDMEKVDHSSGYGRDGNYE